MKLSIKSLLEAVLRMHGGNVEKIDCSNFCAATYVRAEALPGETEGKSMLHYLSKNNSVELRPR